MDTLLQMLSYSSNRQLFSNGILKLNTSFPNTQCTLPCNVVQSEGAQSARSVHTAQCNTATTSHKGGKDFHHRIHTSTWTREGRSICSWDCTCTARVYFVALVHSRSSGESTDHKRRGTHDAFITAGTPREKTRSHRQSQCGQADALSWTHSM